MNCLTGTTESFRIAMYAPIIKNLIKKIQTKQHHSYPVHRRIQPATAKDDQDPFAEECILTTNRQRRRHSLRSVLRFGKRDGRTLNTSNKEDAVAVQKQARICPTVQLARPRSLRSTALFTSFPFLIHSQPRPRRFSLNKAESSTRKKEQELSIALSQQFGRCCHERRSGPSQYSVPREGGGTDVRTFRSTVSPPLPPPPQYSP